VKSENKGVALGGDGIKSQADGGDGIELRVLPLLVGREIGL